MFVYTWLKKRLSLEKYKPWKVGPNGFLGSFQECLHIEAFSDDAFQKRSNEWMNEIPWERKETGNGIIICFVTQYIPVTDARVSFIIKLQAIFGDKDTNLSAENANFTKQSSSLCWKTNESVITIHICILNRSLAYKRNLFIANP